MNSPKISIVTPNFNGGHYLEATIRSVLDQKYSNLEYIIIDGGSTDNSLEIIRKYEDQIAHWESEPDEGLYHAIQKGFDLSSGELMAWINSDDQYHPGSFQTVADIFSALPKVGWIVGAATVFDEMGRTVSVGISKGFTKWDFYAGDFKWIQQESTFWRRSLWERAGSRVDVTMRLAGDFELWLRFFQFDDLHVTDALIGGFRRRSQGQLSMENMDKYLEEVSRSLGRLNLSPGERRKVFLYRVATKSISGICGAVCALAEGFSKRIDSLFNLNRKRIVFDRVKQRFLEL